ncbi:MAG: hypothetical protein ACR2MQ_00440 [Gemmatimonadaceae bacterium]
MTMTAVSGTKSWDAEPAESTAPARARKSAYDATNDAPTNAFAASLAAMLTPRAAPAPKDDKGGAASDLDASTTNASDAAGDLAGASATGSTGTPGTADGAASGTLLSAADAAAAARADASSASVTSVNTDADALNPDFRARLGRVVTRMREEYGNDVELVEGFRPQTRQDALYEQGRTQPGDVVTWTKSSKHTLGLAADVKIDGSYNNTVAFQHLAQIAAQEGLRTLGARDPGHVELPSHGGAAAWGGVAAADATRMNDGVSRAVGLALAQGGAAGSDATGTAGDPHTLNGFLNRMSHTGAGSPVAAQQQSGTGGGAASGFGRQQRNSSEPDTKTSGIADTARVADVAQIAHVADVAQVAQTGIGSAHVAGPHAIVPNDAADRVGRMLDVRDATPALPLSHVTLDLDNANGGTDRITVQLRGGAVDTAISLGDAGGADRMSLRVGELQHALEHHGLEAGSIHVASTAGDTGAGWTPRRGSDQDAHKGQPSPNNRDNRQDAADARQRSRREQQGEKKK